MAHYATQDDVVALYGIDLLNRVADLDRDDTPDQAVVDAGLQAADDLINLMLSGVYTTPITPVSGALRKIAIDIAVYTMAQDISSRTEEMRLRYEDAIAFLKMMKNGDIGLGLPPTDADGDGVPETNPNLRRTGRVITITRG